MKKRLSKIARELKVSISDVANFLRSNGYDCDEDPNEEISIDAVEIINYNFPAFIADRKKYQIQSLREKKQKPEPKPSGEVIPLELKIIEAGSKEKRLIERIIGFTDFEWSFIVAKYKGECSQPVEFNLFDEVICDLLLTEQLSENKIGNILGFDIEKDPAEKEILHTAVTELRRDKMIDGDESIMWLTDVGKDYARNGVKFSTFTRPFELYFDRVGNLVQNVKDIFSKLKSEKIPSIEDGVPIDLTEIRKLAEYQAQEIHFPAKNYLLQSAEFLNAESFKAKVWVILLEDFRDHTLRAIVYDEKQNIVIDALSEALNSQEEIKTQLLEKLIKVEDEIEYTEDEKKDDQIAIENELIQKQGEIDEAVKNKNTDKIKQIESEVQSIKRHFNSLEFEVELKRLFDNTSATLLIQSPWVRDYAFKNRIPFIQNYLKKGGKIFIAYSENESETGDPMVQEESMKKILELEKNNFNFYFCELPPFHYKNVWLMQDHGKNIYYSGSYNILSFFVSQGLKKIRQEKMTRMDWDDELQEQYDDVIRSFGLKYVNKAIEDFNSLCQNPPAKIDREYLLKLKTVDSSKLKPFINQGIEKFNNAYNALEETKNENLNYYRKLFFTEKIEEYRKQTAELVDKPISFDRKRSLQREFEKLRDEFMDFMELQITSAKDVTGMIDNLKTFNINRQLSNNKKGK